MSLLSFYKGIVDWTSSVGKRSTQDFDLHELTLCIDVVLVGNFDTDGTELTCLGSEGPNRVHREVSGCNGYDGWSTGWWDERSKERDVYIFIYTYIY